MVKVASLRNHVQAVFSFWIQSLLGHAHLTFLVVIRFQVKGFLLLSRMYSASCFYCAPFSLEQGKQNLPPK